MKTIEKITLPHPYGDSEVCKVTTSEGVFYIIPTYDNIYETTSFEVKTESQFELEMKGF